MNELQNEILELKKEKEATLLAHYYQPLEIQEIADFLGDSLGLSQIAKNKVETKNIIFAGVVFMAETASILNQEKNIFIPAENACCPLANFLNPEIISDFKKRFPKLPVITYVNTTATVKAESDVCCTSSNAVSIVNKISEDFKVKKVLFGPDGNLADYVGENTDIEIIKIPEDGHCFVHSRLEKKDIEKTLELHPKATVLVHPECKTEVRHIADFVGSTAGMYNYVKKSDNSETEFIIGTERGLIERMAKDFTDKRFHIPSEKLLCKNMKKNSMDNILYILQNIDKNKFEVRVPLEVAEKAIRPINKMLTYSK